MNCKTVCKLVYTGVMRRGVHMEGMVAQHMRSLDSEAASNSKCFTSKCSGTVGQSYGVMEPLPSPVANSNTSRVYALTAL